MRRPRPASVVISAGLAAAGIALAAGLPAQAASGTGWQIVSRHHYGAATVYNGLMDVAAPATKTAWAVGGTDLSGGTAGAPIAERWNGTKWQNSTLPGGLTGTLVAVSAPAAGDIWAVSGLAGYALHWNGTKWSVAKQWTGFGELTGVTAFSPTNVWVFGGPGANPGLGTWHFSGGTWTQVTGLAGGIIRASALSTMNIWALGSINSPGDSIVHLSGGIWRHVKSQALSGLRFQGILALSATNIWATAMLDQTPKLVHFNGTRWRRITVPWQVQLGEPARDGKGGLWMNGQSVSSNTTWAVHRSATGLWTRSKLPSGSAGAVFGFARIPGTTSMWGTGAIAGASGWDATIWGRGPAA
jgi:hypothetical protein